MILAGSITAYLEIGNRESEEPVEKFIELVIALFSAYLAKQIDRRSLMANLERIHTGASAEWARSLHEVRGRHAKYTPSYA